MSPAGYVGYMSWSPDAKKLAFWTWASNKTTSWVYDRTTKQSVKRDEGQPWGLAWSPDSKWLSWPAQNSCKLLDASTGTLTSVTAPAAYTSVNACRWAFDGSFLLMTVDNSAVIAPFVGGSFGSLVDVGM